MIRPLLSKEYVYRTESLVHEAEITVGEVLVQGTGQLDLVFNFAHATTTETRDTKARGAP